MKITDYGKTQNTTQGFPEGDTFINLNEAEFDDYKFRDDSGVEQTKTRITMDGKQYYCPVSVFRELMKIHQSDGQKARVTRTGTTKENTKYTTIKVVE